MHAYVCSFIHMYGHIHRNMGTHKLMGIHAHICMNFGILKNNVSDLSSLCYILYNIHFDHYTQSSALHFILW